ncbi:hypothetical protein CANINC_002520 [Pichia inconspicua]|uniref:Uncharacterized protein n=1 Tax=Pichia inconspicua TaxID=52247 RepID=A0A4T0X2K0_9ASCO|nr:hypothetical protein CANINC_002520 [[Candida] inconspicua]
MSRFVEEEKAEITVETQQENSISSIRDDSSSDNDSDSNERPTGRAKEFYGIIKEERQIKREKQRDEMERELSEFKRVKREKSVYTNRKVDDSDSDSASSSVSVNSKKEDPVSTNKEMTGQQKDGKAVKCLVNYSDSDSD